MTRIAIVLVAACSHAAIPDPARAGGDDGGFSGLAEAITADRDHCDTLVDDYRRLDAVSRDAAAAITRDAHKLPPATLDRLLANAKLMIETANRPRCASTLGASRIATIAGPIVALFRAAAAYDPGRALEDGSAPLPMSPTDQHMDHVLKLLLAAIDPSSDENISLEFLAASLEYRYHHLDEALPLMTDVAGHRDHEAAEYAITLELDLYNRLGRYDDLVALADQVASDTAFLANKPELAHTVASVRHQHARKLIEEVDTEARRIESVDLARECGRRYFELYQSDPTTKDGDELLYDAAVCFEEGDWRTEASHVIDVFRRAYPASPLVAKVAAALRALTH